MSELKHFARIAGDNPFREWLEAQRKESIKYLTNATDMAMIHRAQGRVQLVDELLANLEKAKDLR